MKRRNEGYPGPGARDWALLVGSIAFAVAGLFILHKDRNVGIVTLTLFGACVVVFANNIVRKRRFHRMRPLRAEIAGGVQIRPSRAQALRVSLGFLIVGGALSVFGRSYSALFWCLSMLIFSVGVLLLVGVATRWLPVGYIQFDPEGVTIGRRGWAFLVPWDRVARVAAGEFRDNPVLYLWVDVPEAVVALPAQQQARVLRYLASNLRWGGAHVMLMTGQYELDLPLLMHAIERYLTDPASRSELSRSQLTAGDP
jgi:hypothetical protein